MAPAAGISVGKLVDFEWKIGVAVAGTECKNLKVPYVRVLLHVDGADGRVEAHTFEMSISEFKVCIGSDCPSQLPLPFSFSLAIALFSLHVSFCSSLLFFLTCFFLAFHSLLFFHVLASHAVPFSSSLLSSPLSLPLSSSHSLPLHSLRSSRSTFATFPPRFRRLHPRFTRPSSSHCALLVPLQSILLSQVAQG